METLEKIELEIDTYCHCEIYDEETDTYSQSDSCGGYCHEDRQYDIMESIILPFINDNQLTNYDHLKIEGSGIGWLRQSGYKIIQAIPEQIFQGLMLNGDFTIQFRYEDKKLSAIRYSHDEPMGTGRFYFTKIQVCEFSECETTEDDETLIQVDESFYCEFHKEILAL